MTRILAIDVSNNQKVIAWSAVADATIDGAKIETVFIKATQGTYFVDEYFTANWNAAGAVGLRRIPYHFSDPYGATGAEEANFFRGVLYRNGITTPISYALDQENDGPLNSQLYADLRAHDVDFLQTMESALGITGYYYSRYDFMRRHNLVGSFDLARHKLWLAYPGDLAPFVPRPWGHLSAWQFGQGECPGITGLVDFNYVDE